MSTLFGTDENDSIDGASLPEGTSKIDPKSGDDALTNLDSIYVISGPGNDNISGANIAYALWYATENPFIDLEKGVANDGFGFEDILDGVTTVALPNDKSNPFDSSVIGSAADETVWIYTGNNTINLGDGDDTVIIYDENYQNYEFSYQEKELRVKTLVTGELSTLSGIETVVIRQADYDRRVIFDKSVFTAPISGFIKAEVHRFSDNSTDSDGREYEGQFYPGGLLEFDIQGPMLIDLNGDGSQDAVLPISKGYASGENTRTPFIALVSQNDTLNFDAQINTMMPITSGAVEAEPIQIGASGHPFMVTVNIDTREVSQRNGYKTDPAEFPSELILVQSTASNFEVTSLFPNLPESIPGFPLAVNAHSLAVGDIDGDGNDDIIVSQGGSEGGFQLIQEDDNSFSLSMNEFLQGISTGYWKNDDGTDGDNGISSQILIDVNADGFDDLVVGWGHTGSTSAYVFINQSGEFSLDEKKQIPPSIYGVDNQQALKILSADFDHDGDPDLAIQYVRQVPFYGGSYWQILENDGSGKFIDKTDQISGQGELNAFGQRQTHAHFGQLIDVNKDGHIDLATYRTSNNNPLFYLNDGLGNFEILEVPTAKVGSTPGGNKPALYSDFDGDDRLEFISMNQYENTDGTESEMVFYLYEFNAPIGTGPEFVTSISLGAPGFNESYYLNANPGAKADVSGGKYDTGFDHYLAEGKSAGLSAFAPQTKISGGVGIDTLTLPNSVSDYLVDNASETWTISTIDSQISYSVVGIERIAFADANYAYDLAGHAGQTVKLLGVLLGPDAANNKDYIGEGIKILDSGISYEELMGLAVNFVFGADPNPAILIGSIYNNLVGSEAPQSIIDEYSAALNSGALSPEGLAMAASEHDLNAANIDLIGLSSSGVEFTLG